MLCVYQGFLWISHTLTVSCLTILLYSEVWRSDLIPGISNTVIQDLLQLFSSEASAQSMTWLHQAELGTQLPSLHDDSDEPHVTSAGRGIFAFQKDNGSSTRRQSQVRLRTMLRTSFRGRLKLAQGWKLPDWERPVMNGIGAVKLPGPCKLTERYDPNLMDSMTLFLQWKSKSHTLICMRDRVQYSVFTMHRLYFIIYYYYYFIITVETMPYVQKTIFSLHWR